MLQLTQSLLLFLQIIATLIDKTETSAPKFGIFKFVQSLATFVGYLCLEMVNIQYQTATLGRNIIRSLS